LHDGQPKNKQDKRVVVDFYHLDFAIVLPVYHDNDDSEPVTF
jgi:hypothetical protein